MTRKEIRYEYQDLLVKLQELEKIIKKRHSLGLAALAASNKFVDMVGKIETLQSQCLHPKIIDKQVFPKPDCKQEACADCGKVFKECECVLCGAERELNDPSPGQ